MPNQPVWLYLGESVIFIKKIFIQKNKKQLAIRPIADFVSCACWSYPVKYRKLPINANPEQPNRFTTQSIPPSGLATNLTWLLRFPHHFIQHSSQSGTLRFLRLLPLLFTRVTVRLHHLRCRHPPFQGGYDLALAGSEPSQTLCVKTLGDVKNNGTWNTAITDLSTLNFHKRNFKQNYWILCHVKMVQNEKKSLSEKIKNPLLHYAVT